MIRLTRTYYDSYQQGISTTDYYYIYNSCIAKVIAIVIILYLYHTISERDQNNLTQVTVLFHILNKSLILLFLV